MTEPQVWVLIGVFAAALFGMLWVVTTGFNRTMGAQFETMEARFVTFETRMNARFDAIDAKLEKMHRDIQALSRHMLGTDPR